jgi:hypothetical protein
MRIATPLRVSLIIVGALVIVAALAAVMLPRGTATPPTTASTVTTTHPAAAPVAAAPAPVPARHARATSARPPVVRPIAPGTAGMRAYIDPETGTFGAPSAERLRQEAVSQPLVPVEEGHVVQLPNGAEELVGAPPEYVVATRDANGRLVIRHVTDPKQAKAGTPVPQPVER